MQKREGRVAYTLSRGSPELHRTAAPASLLLSKRLIVGGDLVRTLDVVAPNKLNPRGKGEGEGGGSGGGGGAYVVRRARPASLGAASGLGEGGREGGRKGGREEKMRVKG